MIVLLVALHTYPVCQLSANGQDCLGFR